MLLNLIFLLFAVVEVAYSSPYRNQESYYLLDYYNVNKKAHFAEVKTDLFMSGGNCNSTGYRGVISCTNVPDGIKLKELENGFKIFKGSDDRVYRQIDLASYLFYKTKIPAYLTRIRHPYILLADGKSAGGAAAIEVEMTKKHGFYVVVDKSARKPRQPGAKRRHYLSVKRNLQCYTSASGNDIAQALMEFTKNNLYYRTFLNNCMHLITHLLKRLCGPQVARKARRKMFNLIMYLGSKFPQPKVKTKNPFKFIYVPPTNETMGELRPISSKGEIASVLKAVNLS